MSMGVTVTTPQETFEAVRLRSLRDLEGKRSDAMTLIGIVHLATEGGDPLDALSHLYPRGEVARLKAQRAEVEERKRQEHLLNVLRLYASQKGLGVDDRRNSGQS